jgi:hypothetical protein
VFLQKLIFLCAIPFAAFSGKKLCINENDNVSGMVLIYRSGEPSCSKEKQLSILREGLENDPTEAMLFLQEKGVKIDEINQTPQLSKRLIDLINNTNKMSWGLIFSDRILNQEESINYFKSQLTGERLEFFLTHVAGINYKDQNPFSCYISLVENQLRILGHVIPVLYLAVNNNDDQEISEMFKKLTISSKEPEKKSYKTKQISKKRRKEDQSS